MSDEFPEGWDDATNLREVLGAALGLPGATLVARRLLNDGILWVLRSYDDRGWTLIVTHAAPSKPDELMPGRVPTMVELYQARQMFIPAGVLMVALIEPSTTFLLTRLLRTRGREVETPGLSTTVRCVQMHVEEVTDDVVQGQPA